MRDRKLHVDTLILIPTCKIYVFPYSRWMDRQTDGQTDRDINPVWAFLTTFLQFSLLVSEMSILVHPLRVAWRNLFPLS
jgi:hypothetical protein